MQPTSLAVTPTAPGADAPDAPAEPPAGTESNEKDHLADAGDSEPVNQQPAQDVVEPTGFDSSIATRVGDDLEDEEDVALFFSPDCFGILTVLSGVPDIVESLLKPAGDMVSSKVQAWSRVPRKLRHRLVWSLVVALAAAAVLTTSLSMLR